MKTIDKKEALFLAKFFAITIAAQALLILFEPVPLENAIAMTSGRLLGLESNGNAVYTANGEFIISQNCTGLLSAAAFAAIVFSLKKPSFKEKALSTLAAGATIVAAINPLRLLIVIEAGNLFGMEIADAVHIASWFLMFFAVMWLWMQSIRKKRLTAEELI